jgi:hypothetical protein
MEALISCRGFEGGRAPPYTWREWSGKSAAHKGHSDNNMIPLMTLSTSRRHAMRSLYDTYYDESDKSSVSYV